MADEATTSDSVETAPTGETPKAELSTQDISTTGSAPKTEAVTTSEESSQASDEAETTPEESDNVDEDAEVKEWAAKKNLPLDDPIKIAKMYRESEKALGKKGQQEGQLTKAVAEANTSVGAEDVQSLRNEVAALNFYIQHPEAKQYEAEMVNILDTNPELAGHLDFVLDAAKGRTTTQAEALVAERKAGKQEALAQTAKADRAALPKASANQAGYESNKITAENVDAQIGAHMGDRVWYDAHKAEIDAALRG